MKEWTVMVHMAGNNNLGDDILISVGLKISR